MSWKVMLYTIQRKMLNLREIFWTVAISFLAVSQNVRKKATENCWSHLDVKIRNTSPDGAKPFTVVCLYSLTDSHRSDSHSSSSYLRDSELEREKRFCSEPVIQINSVMWELANRMKWTEIIIITDNCTEHIVEWNDMHKQQYLLLNIDKTESANFTNILTQQHHRLFKNKFTVNVMVICSPLGRRQALQIITEVKMSLHRFSAFDMKSLWLIAIEKTERELARAWSSALQNVAFIVSETKHLSSVRLKNVSSNICNRERDYVGETVPDNSSILISKLYPLTQYGMNNITLTVSTLPFHTYVIRNKKNGTNVYTGLCISILNIISHRLNFSYIIVEPPDGQWGKNFGNGTYNGMVAQILNQEIDLIAAPLIPQPDRIDKMDFTIPYSWDRIVVIFKKPISESTRWLTLVHPFQFEVFLCIGASLVFIVCFMVFTEWTNPYYSPEARQVCTVWQILRHFTWYAYGSLIKHGGQHLPDSMSGRFAIGFWLLFCTIISAVYSANLIAFLTVNVENIKFHTVEDVLDEDSFTWGSTGNYPFRTLKNGEDKRLWARIEDKRLHKWYGELPRHLPKLQNGSYVFVNHYDILKAWASADCDLQVIVPKLSVPVTYTFGLPFNSDFTAVFSNSIMRLIDSGTLDAIISRLNKDSNSKSCNKQNQTKAKSVDLEDLQSAFYLLGAGLFVSVITVFAELIHKHVTTRKKQRKPNARKKLSRFF